LHGLGIRCLVRHEDFPMSQQTIIKCDICGKFKGDANKWVKFTRDDTSMWIGINGESDACSDACIQKALAPVLDRIRNYDHATTATIKESEAYREDLGL
jgi:hypothetical protein